MEYLPWAKWKNEGDNVQLEEVLVRGRVGDRALGIEERAIEEPELRDVSIMVASDILQLGAITYALESLATWPNQKKLIDHMLDEHRKAPPEGMVRPTIAQFQQCHKAVWTWIFEKCDGDLAADSTGVYPLDKWAEKAIDTPRLWMALLPRPAADRNGKGRGKGGGKPQAQAAPGGKNQFGNLGNKGGGGKGAGGGGGGGKNNMYAPVVPGCRGWDNDGLPYCRRFHAQPGGCPGNCGFSHHCCWWGCEEAHRVLDCPLAAAQWQDPGKAGGKGKGKGRGGRGGKGKGKW